jgi:phosphatidylglycerophosphatase C
LLAVIPASLRFLFDRDRGALKQSLLRMTLRGMPRAELTRESELFVRDTITRRCFDDALAAIRRHRDAGHFLVLMSASVDFYVPEFGRQLGFDQVISTGVRWNGDRLDGTLTTTNRRGEEKARCVRELLAQRDDHESFAYGNSDSDLPHLAIVRHGLLVNGSAGARRAAATLGVASADWT